MPRKILILIVAGQAMQLAASAIVSVALAGPVDTTITVLTLATIAAAIFAIGGAASWAIISRR